MVEPIDREEHEKEEDDAKGQPDSRWRLSDGAEKRTEFLPSPMRKPFH